MARPFTPAQQRENAAYLLALRRSGNIRLAAREVGIAYGTLQHRRRAHPPFAVAIAQALVFAESRLTEGEAAGHALAGREGAGPYRTAGGEPVVVRLASGRIQMRRAQPGKLTRHAEQAFLLAVAASANISLAAKAVGVAEAAFYRRKRRDPAFARELREALALGYERLEAGLLESWMPDDAEGTQWRANEPPALPPMTTAQALQLMYLHHKDVRWRESEMRRRVLPGECDETRRDHLARLYRAKLVAEAEDAIGARLAGTDGAAPLSLPDLAAVTGWSNATGTVHGPAALFGGWRIDRLSAAERVAGRAAGQAAAELANTGRRILGRKPRVSRGPGRQLLPGTKRRGRSEGED